MAGRRLPQRPFILDRISLYGTVCAVDPLPQPTATTGTAQLVDLVDRQARLISTVLAVERQVDETRRRAERAESEALMDPLTGLVNRRGWELLLDREEQRCRRYGALASVLMIDLDGLKAVNDTTGAAAYRNSVSSSPEPLLRPGACPSSGTSSGTLCRGRSPSASPGSLPREYVAPEQAASQAGAGQAYCDGVSDLGQRRGSVVPRRPGSGGGEG